MRMFRRGGAIALSVLVVSAFLISPASADNVVETRPETFAATANARAAYIELLGIKVSLGSSGISIDSGPSAKATGAGLLLAPGTVSDLATTAAGQKQAPPKACVLNIDPPLLSLLGLQVACGEARVDSTVGAPQAFAKGEVLGLTLGGAQLLAVLKPILDALTPILDQTIGTVNGVVRPLLGQILDPLLASLNLNPNALVSSLVDRLEEVTSLATVSVGNSTSEGTSSATAITSTAFAQGGLITLLPGLALGGAPLLQIEVGSAKATSSFDRGAAKSTPAFDAAIARIKSPLLGLDVPISLTTPLDLDLGILRLQVSLGAGKATTNNDGSVGAVADGVSVNLTTPIGSIIIQLAHAESAIGGQGRLVEQQKVIEPVAQMAKTGNDPWVPLAGFVLLLAAFTTRRLVAARVSGNREPADR